MALRIKRGAIVIGFYVGQRVVSLAVNTNGRRGVVSTVYGRATACVRVRFDGQESSSDHATEFLRDAASYDASELFEGGDWQQQQEEQQQSEGPSVADQIAEVEGRIADLDTLIACESGSCRTYAIESRHYLNERLRALKWAIEARDLPALTQIVAANNAERAEVAA